MMLLEGVPSMNKVAPRVEEGERVQRLTLGGEVQGQAQRFGRSAAFLTSAAVGEHLAPSFCPVHRRSCCLI